MRGPHFTRAIANNCRTNAPLDTIAHDGIAVFLCDGEPNSRRPIVIIIVECFNAQSDTVRAYTVARGQKLRAFSHHVEFRI